MGIIVGMAVTTSLVTAVSLFGCVTRVSLMTPGRCACTDPQKNTKQINATGIIFIFLNLIAIPTNTLPVDL